MSRPNAASRETPRPRHIVGRRTIRLLKPFFRYSRVRDAYVLRLIGRHRGPVLRLKRPGSAPAPHPREAGRAARARPSPHHLNGTPGPRAAQPAEPAASARLAARYSALRRTLRVRRRGRTRMARAAGDRLHIRTRSRASQVPLRRTGRSPSCRRVSSAALAAGSGGPASDWLILLVPLVWSGAGGAWPSTCRGGPNTSHGYAINATPRRRREVLPAGARAPAAGLRLQPPP